MMIERSEMYQAELRWWIRFSFKKLSNKIFNIPKNSRFHSTKGTFYALWYQSGVITIIIHKSLILFKFPPSATHESKVHMNLTRTTFGHYVAVRHSLEYPYIYYVVVNTLNEIFRDRRNT